MSEHEIREVVAKANASKADKDALLHQALVLRDEGALFVVGFWAKRNAKEGR